MSSLINHTAILLTTPYNELKGKSFKIIDTDTNHLGEIILCTDIPHPEYSVVLLWVNISDVLLEPIIFIEKVNFLLSRITMSMLGNKTFKFIIEKDKKGGDRVYIQLEYSAPCTKGNINTFWKGRKWYLSEHMTENEIIFTAYTAYEMCLKHEMMETFKVDGIILVNPHVDYKELLKVSTNEITRK